MDADPLALSPERMREMGYAVVDMLVARMEALREGPVLQTETLDAMRHRLARDGGGRRPARPTSMSSWPASTRTSSRSSGTSTIRASSGTSPAPGRGLRRSVT